MTLPFIKKKHQIVTKHQVDMDKIHKCHHKKQEEVDQIPQERKETVSTSKESDKLLLQHITTLSHLIPQRIQNHTNETKQQLSKLTCTGIKPLS